MADDCRVPHIQRPSFRDANDVVCPATSAWDLHRAWPEADVRIVRTPDSGIEAGNTTELVAPRPTGIAVAEAAERS